MYCDYGFHSGLKFYLEFLVENITLKLLSRLPSMKFHISRIIGEHYIWWFAQKTLLARFKLAVLSTISCSINGLIMA